MSLPEGVVWRVPGVEDAVWILGGLYSYKARGRDTGDAYSLFEVQGPVATPKHLHEAEDEAFFVAAGEVSFLVGDELVTGGPGTFALVPRGVPHGFRLESADARLLLLITPGDAGHESLFAEMGVPAERHVVPPPPTVPPDFLSLGEIAARHGTKIVGPPIGEGS